MRDQRLVYLRKLGADEPRPPAPRPRSRAQQPARRGRMQGEPRRYRFVYEKLGAAAFLSHLDLDPRAPAIVPPPRAPALLLAGLPPEAGHDLRSRALARRREPLRGRRHQDRRRPRRRRVARGALRRARSRGCASSAARASARTTRGSRRSSTWPRYVVGVPRAAVASRGGEAWLRERDRRGARGARARRGAPHRRDRQASGRARLPPHDRARRRGRRRASRAPASSATWSPSLVEVDVRGSGGVKIAEVVEAVFDAELPNRARAHRARQAAPRRASPRRSSSTRYRKPRTSVAASPPATPRSGRRPGAQARPSGPSRSRRRALRWGRRSEQAQRAAHVGVLARADVAPVGRPRRVPRAVFRVREDRAIAHVRPAPRRRRVGQRRLAIAGVGRSEREPDASARGPRAAPACRRAARRAASSAARTPAWASSSRYSCAHPLPNVVAPTVGPRRYDAEGARDHLRRAGRVAVDQRRHRPSPSIDAGRLGRAVGLEGPVAALHRKERRAGDEEAERVDGAVGRAAAVAAQVEHDARRSGAPARSRSRRMARVSSSPRSSRTSWMATTIASPSPYSMRSTGSSSSSSAPAAAVFAGAGAAVEPGRHRRLLAGAEDDRLRRRARVGRGEAELLGLLVAEPRRRDARQRQHDVAVGERRASRPTRSAARWRSAPPCPRGAAAGAPRGRPRRRSTPRRAAPTRRAGSIAGTYARTAAARTTPAQSSALGVREVARARRVDVRLARPGRARARWRRCAGRGTRRGSARVA